MTTTHTTGSTLGADDLDVLAAVLETILPGDDEMPPASKTGAAHAIDGYLTERSGLRAPFLDALVAIRITAHAHGGEFGALPEASLWWTSPEFPLSPSQECAGLELQTWQAHPH